MDRTGYVVRELQSAGVKLPAIRRPSQPRIEELPPLPLPRWAGLNPSARLTLNSILMEVCEATEISAALLRSPSRQAWLIPARVLFYTLALDLTTKSTTQIGDFINRDHTTIIQMTQSRGQATRATDLYKTCRKRLEGLEK